MNFQGGLLYGSLCECVRGSPAKEKKNDRIVWIKKRAVAFSFFKSQCNSPMFENPRPHMSALSSAPMDSISFRLNSSAVL